MYLIIFFIFIFYILIKIIYSMYYFYNMIIIIQNIIKINAIYFSINRNILILNQSSLIYFFNYKIIFEKY